MGIPLGKIQLYVGGGGFHPEHSLPALIDNGTNTKSLIEDKFYFVRAPAPAHAHRAARRRRRGLHKLAGSEPRSVPGCRHASHGRPGVFVRRQVRDSDEYNALVASLGGVYPRDVQKGMLTTRPGPSCMTRWCCATAGQQEGAVEPGGVLRRGRGVLHGRARQVAELPRAV
jgi:hypothetical protein